AALSQRLGDWPAAATHLKESAAISTATGDSGGLRITRKFLANVALATGDLATAKRLTVEQLAWARLIDAPVEQYEAQQTLAGIAIRERDWVAATKALDGSRLLLSVIS